MTSLTLDLECSASGKLQTVVLHGDGIDPVKVGVETSTKIAIPDTLDGPLCTAIFHAMKHASSLKVNGPISEKLLRNITLFQEAWHCHYPGQYRPIDVLPSTIYRDEHNRTSRLNSGPIQTFSGGVDSIFSLVRHGENKAAGMHAPNSILFVHGFDIPCSNQSDFDAVRRRVEKMADTLGVELHVIKTTLRDNIPDNWEHSHGAALAGVLHLFAKTHRLGVIASSDPYNYVSFVPHAWGSSPATDYLLSGSEMEIAHDGAGFSRPEKVAYLAKNFPDLLRLSQFCWQGKVRSENCGVCDKCIHTRLSLRAAGVGESLCFDSNFEKSMIDTMKFGEETLGDILPLLEFANSSECTEAWVGEIRERVSPFLPVMYKSNRSVAKSVRYFRAAIRELLR